MDKKLTKAEARYQPHPKATKRCSGCAMYREIRSCTAVQGDISPNGWCRLWEKK